MSKPLSSAQLHLCRPRAVIPGGSSHERQLDRERILHQQGPSLIQSELNRIRPEPEPLPHTFFDRIYQAIDVLLGRTNVFVDRRHPRA